MRQKKVLGHRADFEKFFFLQVRLNYGMVRYG